MLNTNDWKEYCVSRLFDISAPASRKMSEYSEGNTPYVSSGATNNGIVSYLKPKNKDDIERGNCITVSPLDGASFYQKNNFLGRGGAGSAISILRNDNLTEYNALFICSVLRVSAYKYNYSDALKGENLKNLMIKLPSVYMKGNKDYSDEEYVPDWGYMDSYMKNQINQSTSSVDNINNFESPKHLIDVNNWKNYSITELFDLSLPKGDLQVKQVSDGDTLLITPSAYNNGLLKRISSKSDSTLYDENAITVDMFGNAYFHEEKFFVTAHGHVNVLIPKFTINRYIGMYLATSIRAMFLDKYGFTEMCTLKILKSESLCLPRGRNGNPNWNYMESYMKSVMSDCEKIISTLKTI